MRNKLIEFRKSLNFTQEEISNELGITLTYYSKIEQGRRNPSYNFLNKMKKTFPKISIDYIFFDIANTERVEI